MKDSTKAWIEHAKRDLKAAEILINQEYVANIALFHCQQAVEKTLKAVLEENCRKIPKTHDIYKLYSMISDQNENIHLDENEIDLIDDIYINFRYPSEMGLMPNGFPSKKEATKIFEISNKIVVQIMALID